MKGLFQNLTFHRVDNSEHDLARTEPRSGYLPIAPESPPNVFEPRGGSLCDSAQVQAAPTERMGSFVSDWYKQGTPTALCTMDDFFAVFEPSHGLQDTEHDLARTELRSSIYMNPCSIVDHERIVSKSDLSSC